MKNLILILALISAGVFASDESALCLNKDLYVSGSQDGVKVGQYYRSGGTNSNPIYSVDSSAVIGDKKIIALKVRWIKDYPSKNQICFITSDKGNFCGLVKTGGEKVKPFEKCQ